MYLKGSEVLRISFGIGNVELRKNYKGDAESVTSTLTGVRYSNLEVQKGDHGKSGTYAGL